MEHTNSKVGAELLRLTLACRNADKLAAARVGLTVDEMHFLGALYLDRPTCVRELSELLRISATRASKILHSLEQRGLVMRALHPSDRRMEQVSLTEEGQRTAENIVACFRDEQGTALRKMTTELTKQFSWVLPAVVWAYGISSLTI